MNSYARAEGPPSSVHVRTSRALHRQLYVTQRAADCQQKFLKKQVSRKHLDFSFKFIQASFSKILFLTISSRLTLLHFYPGKILCNKFFFKSRIDKLYMSSGYVRNALTMTECQRSRLREGSRMALPYPHQINLSLVFY